MFGWKLGEKGTEGFFIMLEMLYSSRFQKRKTSLPSLLSKLLYPNLPQGLRVKTTAQFLI
jgi:KaiC/GvpD/RAD55 family RecA-like ATPase